MSTHPPPGQPPLHPERARLNAVACTDCFAPPGQTCHNLLTGDELEHQAAHTARHKLAARTEAASGLAGRRHTSDGAGP